MTLFDQFKEPPITPSCHYALEDADHRDRGAQLRGGGGHDDHYWDYHSEGGYRGGYNSYNRQRNSRRY